jgi:hypothetical protein
MLPDINGAAAMSIESVLTNPKLSPEIAAVMARAMARRLASGLAVETTLDGHTARQYFRDAPTRDEYLARAKRCGAAVEIVAG